ncbi:MAG: hypothetical protein WKG01_08910 [Kofleriaceae bacterium]
MVSLTRDAATARATQPMRVLEDQHADTIPPPGVLKQGAGENIELAKTDPGLTQVKDTDLKVADTKAAADKPAEPQAAVPTEIATADTGRVSAPKGDKNTAKGDPPDTDKKP